MLLISRMGVRGQAGIVMSPRRDVFQMLRSGHDKGVVGGGEGEGGGVVGVGGSRGHLMLQVNIIITVDPRLRSVFILK